MAAPAPRRDARPDAAAVIVAGGKGLRFGGRIRKQYLPLRRRPLLWWSLRAFDRSPSFGALVLVVPADDLGKLRSSLAGWKLRKLAALVPGGSTRADSVRQGVQAVPPGYRYIAVHDAVRPLVTVAAIEKILVQARRHGAAIAAAPSRDTVKLADRAGFIRSSPSRETVWLAQTPQIFERKLLERAHRRKRGLAPGPVPTDDSQLVEHLRVRVKLVEPNHDNFKVTLPADLWAAHHILRRRN